MTRTIQQALKTKESYIKDTTGPSLPCGLVDLKPGVLYKLLEAMPSLYVAHRRGDPRRHIPMDAEKDSAVLCLEAPERTEYQSLAFGQTCHYIRCRVLHVEDDIEFEMPYFDAIKPWFVALT